jgi:hypothetical protein
LIKGLYRGDFKVRKFIPKRSIFIIGLLIVFLGSGYFFLFTPVGGSLLIRGAVSRLSKGANIEFLKASGSLIGKMTLEDIRVQGLRGLPHKITVAVKRVDLRLAKLLNVFIVGEDITIATGELADSRILVQKADIAFNGANMRSISIKVSNGRLVLPNSQLVLFHGDYTNESLNFNIYSNAVGIESLIRLFVRQDAAVPVKGTLADIDLDLQGSIRKPVVKGAALVQELSHKAFTLSDAHCDYDLAIRNEARGILVDGSLAVKDGKISGPGTAPIQLAESRLLFSGPAQKPGFDIKADTTVGKTKIKIFLKGTMDKPDLRLLSDPPLPQDQLLAMVATGRNWGATGSASGQGAIPADMAADFVDYFVLGGSGKKISDRFGITGSFTVEEKKQSVQVKKSVSENVEVGYGVVKEQGWDSSQQTTQNVNAELKVTDTVSLSAEREMKQTDTQSDSSEEQKSDNKVMIKYKKSF